MTDRDFHCLGLRDRFPMFCAALANGSQRCRPDDRCFLIDTDDKTAEQGALF